MQKKENRFGSWLAREVARRGRQREVAELLEEMKIEDQLIDLRHRRGLSQAELAEVMGVKQPVVARIESGRIRNLTLATIARTAESLGARVEVRLVPLTVAGQRSPATSGQRRRSIRRAAK